MHACERADLFDDRCGLLFFDTYIIYSGVAKPSPIHSNDGGEGERGSYQYMHVKWQALGTCIVVSDFLIHLYNIMEL
jgi:hypothetical protein